MGPKSHPTGDEASDEASDDVVVVDECATWVGRREDVSEDEAVAAMSDVERAVKRVADERWVDVVRVAMCDDEVRAVVKMKQCEGPGAGATTWASALCDVELGDGREREVDVSVTLPGREGMSGDVMGEVEVDGREWEVRREVWVDEDGREVGP